jgi:hypothetical protein
MAKKKRMFRPKGSIDKSALKQFLEYTIKSSNDVVNWKNRIPSKPDEDIAKGLRSLSVKMHNSLYKPKKKK